MRWLPSACAVCSVAPAAVSACDCEASSTPSAAGTVTTNPETRSRARRGSRADLHHRASGQRDERAAAEREVERGEEDDDRDRGEAPRREMAMRGEAEREQDRDRRQQPEGVPVADRLGQLVAARRVVRPADVTGEEPGAERVERHQHGSRDDTAQEPSRGLAGGQKQQRRCRRRDVEDAALRLEHRGCRAGRPERGEGGPACEQRQAAEERQLEPAGAWRIGDEDEGDRDEREAEGREPPVAREVPAVGGPEPGHRDEGGQERRRHACRPRQERGVRAGSLGGELLVERAGLVQPPAARCSRRSACRRSGSAARSSHRSGRRGSGGSLDRRRGTPRRSAMPFSSRSALARTQ